MSESANKAVFLSYASQDAEAAKRICEALRAAGVEVWFDQNELVGGDAWDQKIRGQISSCALFVPIISANTNARSEGYFRLEWKLAVDRSHLLADDHPFLFPIVIGDVSDATARVPDKFREVQWTRLRLDETPAELAGRVTRLLRGAQQSEAGDGRPEAGENRKSERKKGREQRPAWLRHAWAVIGLIFAVYYGMMPIWKPWFRDKAPPTAEQPAAPSKSTSEARQLVAKAWELLNKPSMARAELDAADALCKRAATLDPTDAEVWAAWSHVNVWYCFHNLDKSTPRQEAAREYAARGMQLDPKSYEARLAQAFYWVRGDATHRRLGEAQGLLRELLRERPDEPRTLFTLGYSLIGAPKTESEGVALLERLARNADFAAVAWDEIGWAAYFKRDWPKAETAVARSLAAEPYWNNLGLKITLAERVQGDMDLAESALQQMPASALQEDWGIGFACQVYQWRREPLRTIEVLDSVSRDWIHYYFYNYPKVYLLGEARLMAKQESAARRDFQRARVLIEKQLTDDPNNGYLLGLQARTLLHLGEREEAEKSYRLVKELGGTDNLQLWFAPPAAGIAFIRSMAAATQGDVIGRTFFSAASLRLDPYFDRFRAEPAFQALLTELEATNKPATSSSPASGLIPLSSPPAVDAKSVAVLAFANLSDDKGNEYFSDGISEELLNVLAKVPGLKVTARTSSFHFKGKDTPIPEIAKQLGVAYVVEGSVRKQGDKVRITAQLIKAADGFHVWSDTFTRDLKDIFAVQDEIAGIISKNLSLKLGTATPSIMVNPEAFRLYLEGREEWRNRIGDSLPKAEMLFKQASTLDPEFARAHAGLADVWATRAILKKRYGGDATQDYAQANAALDRALQIDPELAEAHATRGNLYASEGKTDEAALAFQRALVLNPSYASAHQWYGRLLFDSGKFDAGLTELEIAMRLDPLSRVIASNYGMYLGFARRWAEALAAADRSLAILPNGDQAFWVRTMALIGLGRAKEALQGLRERNGVAGGDQPELVADPLWRAESLARAGDHDAARALAGPALEANAESSPSQLVFNLHLAFGRPDDAFAYAQRGNLRVVRVAYVYLDPLYDGVRDDPRFLRLLKEAGVLEQYRDAWAQYLAWKKQTAQP